jgi:hypothetical protein
MELVDSDFDVCNLKKLEFHLRSSNYIALRGDRSKRAGVHVLRGEPHIPIP